MAEEQRWAEAAGGLCANNCGFFGSPTTLNLCSKCYRDHCLNMSKAMPSVEKTLPHPEPKLESTAPYFNFGATVSVPLSLPAEEEPNRCSTCRRRVGLTGFKCKCGPIFCRTHRYPEQHGCTFDFKASGKPGIAKANPIVKADKLHKI